VTRDTQPLSSDTRHPLKVNGGFARTLAPPSPVKYAIITSAAVNQWSVDIGFEYFIEACTILSSFVASKAYQAR
jgi:hypothetical protein